MMQTDNEQINFGMNSMNNQQPMNDIMLSREMHRCEIGEAHEMSPLGPTEEANAEKQQSSTTQDSGIIYSDGSKHQVVDLDKVFG